MNNAKNNPKRRYVEVDQIQVAEFWVPALIDGEYEYLTDDEYTTALRREEELTAYARLIGPSVLGCDVEHVYFNVKWSTLSFTRCDVTPGHLYSMCYSVSILVR